MVGPLLIWKLIHCKRLKKQKTIPYIKEDKSIIHQSVEDITIKEELNETQTCRVCLKEGDIAIYDNNSLEDIPEALSTFGGIKIKFDDVYPKYLCQSCHALLQGAILFRRTAQESDQILHRPNDTSDDDCSIIRDTESQFNFEVKDSHNKMYYCKKCEVEFNTFDEYSQHRLSEEHENQRHTCQICNNTYSSLYFKKHMALHTLESSYVCDICGKKFIVKGQFTRHRFTHFHNFPFKCSLCPYKGRFKESLKMHMRTHSGEKPYKCTHCPSKFVSKSNLNKHMLTHKGSFDFKCETCGRGFYTKKALEQHFQVDHTGIKDHICNICGKAFGYRKQMMKHQLKVHKREKFQSGRRPLYLQIEPKNKP